jgi:enoyl-CoA hydratase
MMAVRVERAGAVTTIVLDRPERRNAVDGVTAREPADAFRDFDADAAARVAVLWGAGDTFCAGADLKPIATASGNRLRPVGDGPLIGLSRALDLILTRRPVDARDAERI